MNTYRNTIHLGIIPKVGDITDMGRVILITEDGLIISDHQRQKLLSPEAVNLVIRQRTIQ